MNFCFKYHNLFGIIIIIFLSFSQILEAQKMNDIFMMSSVGGEENMSKNCEVNINFNKLGIKLYPNPDFTKTNLILVNPPPINEIFKISIWGVDGFKITSGKATGQDLFQGLPLDFSMLLDGTYFIQIESGKYTDAIKFIKTNN